MESKTQASQKRLFFGFDVSAPWQDAYPEGRLIQEDDRHQTVAFLGSCDYERLKTHLNSLPKPTWKVGLIGIAKGLLFLPFKHPSCVSIDWELQESKETFFSYHNEILAFLIKENFLKKEERDFLLHVTLCRKPFKEKEWLAHFEKIPLICGSLHLYESLGSSRYKKIWTFPILPPFEEIPHTADIAFKVRAHSLQQLGLHAFMALASKAKGLLKDDFSMHSFSSLEELIASLNHSIALLDMREGSPLKAVSYHGNIKQNEDGTIEWEMIIDV